MNEKFYCTKPDKDIPELLCGAIMPCLYHTIQTQLVLEIQPPNMYERITRYSGKSAKRKKV